MAKNYDPSQPRVPKGNPEGGQWTQDQLFTMEESARKAAGLPNSREVKIREQEKALRNKKYEKVLIFDKSGNLINFKGGTKNAISITRGVPADEKLLHDMEGSITSHNHPNSDLPFSWVDMKNSGLYHELESRVVGNNVTHILRPTKFDPDGKARWFGIGKKSADFMADVFNDTIFKVLRERAIDTSWPWSFEDMPMEEQIDVAWEAQERIARFYDWEYERIPNE